MTNDGAPTREVKVNRLERSVPTLLSLLKVVEEGSINKAAHALHISQPALTRHIANLEKLLGVTLLDRSAKGVSLTPSGEVLIESARAVRADLHDAVRGLQALAGNSASVVRVGVTPTVLAHFLPSALELLHRDSPGIAVQVAEGARPELDQLRAAGLDLVIAATALDAQDADIETKHLFALDLCVVVGRAHPLRKRANLELADLTSWQWIMPRSDSGFYRRIQSDFRGAGIGFPPVAIEMATPGAIKTLLQSTDLIAPPSGRMRQ